MIGESGTMYGQGDLIVRDEYELDSEPRVDLEPAGFVKLEDMSYSQRQRVYFGYISTIKGIIDRFEVQLSSLRIGQTALENERKNLEKNNFFWRLCLIIVGALLAGVIMIFVGVSLFNEKTGGQSAFSGGGMGPAMNGVGEAIIGSSVIMIGSVLGLMILAILPQYISSHVQYQYFMEAKPYRKSIAKNNAATYINQSDYYSGEIISLEKRKKKYEKLLKKIELNEVVTEKEVAIVDDTTNIDYSVKPNTKVDYRITLRDVPAIIFHKDNWGPSTIREKNDKVYRKR